MELLSIGIKEGYREVEKLLFLQVEKLRSKGINIETRSTNIGNMTFIAYESGDDNKFTNLNNIFKYYISDIISDIILDIYQEKMVTKIINESYYYFGKTEREEIKIKALEYLNKTELFTTDGINYKISRKAKILKSVIEYLESNKEMILEGFINFRLKFLMDMIEDAIEKSVEEYLMEKEYKEFVKVLQYFVNIQEPKTHTVNILVSNDRKYTLFDENYELINNDFLEEIADEIVDNDLNYDDLLVSSLITIAPMKIIIHFGYNDYNKNNFKEILKVIESVFEDKVSICKGCEFCLSVKNGVTHKKN